MGLGAATLGFGASLLAFLLFYQVTTTNPYDPLLAILTSLETVAAALLFMGLTMTCLAVLVNPRKLL